MMTGTVGRYKMCLAQICKPIKQVFVSEILKTYSIIVVIQ